jgi:colicin import membrane protein
MSKNVSPQPPDRSWLYITCTVIAVHSLIIGWSVFFTASHPISLPKIATRLAVQTIALNSNPIPSNINTPTPIPPTPIPPTPLERKTMSPSSEPVNPPKQQQMPPAPAQTTPVETPEKTVPKTPLEAKAAAKKNLEKATEDFKAKQQEIINKRKQELETLKTQQADAAKKKQQAELKKKQEQEAAKKKAAEEQLAENKRQQQLLTQAQERIAKISGNRDKQPSNKATGNISDVPHAITSLAIDSLSEIKGDIVLSRYELSYREELAGRLKLLLRLPEYGDVKVNLTLDRSGKVSKVAIVNADSSANRKYIEKTLPELSFPPFGDHYASAAEYTFSITLSNEI